MQDLENGLDPNSPQPFCTFSCPSTAFHLMRDHNFKRMNVDEAAMKFQIPDLRAALADYMTHVQHSNTLCAIGGRHLAPINAQLPFSHLEIWTHIHLQSKSFHAPHAPLSPRIIFAAPACDQWPLGHHDAVIVNTDISHKWPQSGIQGICVSISMGNLKLMRSSRTPCCRTSAHL